MSYLVMECHPAYVVVLDEQGQFLKAANMGYRTGQCLPDIIGLEMPAASVPRRRRWPAIAAAAACLAIAMLTSWNFAFSAYGTVRLQINPDVELTVNRLDYVIGAEGLNEDGVALLDGWDRTFKKIDEASGQLTQRAGELGYLKEDGIVRVKVISDHNDWRSGVEQQLVAELEDSVPPTVHIVPVDPDDDDDDLFDDADDPDDYDDDDLYGDPDDTDDHDDDDTDDDHDDDDYDDDDDDDDLDNDDLHVDDGPDDDDDDDDDDDYDD